MRKFLFLILLTGMLMMVPGVSVFADGEYDTNFEIVNKDQMINAGFSPYLADLTLLQKSKHEDEEYERPDKVRTWFYNFAWGDILIPTQSFGYYEIDKKE